MPHQREPILCRLIKKFFRMTSVITFDEGEYLEIRSYVLTFLLHSGMATIFMDSHLDRVQLFLFNRTYLEAPD